MCNGFTSCVSAPLSEHMRQCAGLAVQNRGEWVCVGETGNSRSENGSLVTNWVCVPRHFDEISFLTQVAGWLRLNRVRGQDHLLPRFKSLWIKVSWLKLNVYLVKLLKGSFCHF